MRTSVWGVFVLAAAFVACSSRDSAVEAWTGELPISAPWLRDRLPAGIVAYARIPNALGLLAMPKGSMLDEALRSSANVRNVEAIRAAFAANVLSLPTFADPRFELLVDVLRSPLELAAYGMPGPSVLIGATLSLRSREDFEALFEDLSAAAPGAPRLAAPLDDAGIGELVGLPIGTLLQFEAATGRLLILAGPGLTRGTLTQVLQTMPTEPTDHPMYALERRIDASGQGLFVWVDAARVVPMAQAFAPVDLDDGLAAMGFGGLNAVAFGVGSANGKGRLSFVVDVGTDRTSRLLPVVENDVAAASVGEPNAAVILSIVSPAEFARLESLWVGRFVAEESWTQAKAQFRARFGFELTELSGALGPDLVLLFDEAGEYVAVRLRDSARLDDLLRRAAEAAGTEIETREIRGTTFHHLGLPSAIALPAAADAQSNEETRDALTLLGRLKTHLYWIREGDYLYVAATPQTLMDRVRAGADTSVAEWLAERQRIDVSGALLAATASLDSVPRRNYENYLKALLAMADLADADIDVWSMPTANQLELPDRGTIGVDVSLGEPYLSLDLLYENHPAEAFFGGSAMATVAGLGILAAIALPAYQDYTIRAQVSEGLNLAAAARAGVAAAFVAEGVPPASRSEAGLSAAPDDTMGRYVEAVDVENGVVTIYYGNEANLAISGETLTLTPYETDEGAVVWRCGYGAPPPGARPLGTSAGRPTEYVGPTIPSRYLPAACR